MIPTQNKEINKVIQQKHDLIREYDNNKISKYLYDKQIVIFENTINELTKEHLLQLKQNIIKQGETIMAKEKVKEEKKMKEEPKVRGPKIKSNTMASAIADALMLKSLKTIDAVANKVVEKKPEVSKEKAMKFIKIIIKETKKGKGRWRNYNWSEEEYLLTLKQ